MINTYIIHYISAHVTAIHPNVHTHINFRHAYYINTVIHTHIKQAQTNNKNTTNIIDIYYLHPCIHPTIQFAWIHTYIYIQI